MLKCPTPLFMWLAMDKETSIASFRHPITTAYLFPRNCWYNLQTSLETWDDEQHSYECSCQGCETACLKTYHWFTCLKFNYKNSYSQSKHHGYIVMFTPVKRRETNCKTLPVMMLATPTILSAYITSAEQRIFLVTVTFQVIQNTIPKQPYPRWLSEQEKWHILILALYQE